MMKILKLILISPIRWYLSDRERRNALIEKNVLFTGMTIFQYGPTEVRELGKHHRDLVTNMRNISNIIDTVSKEKRWENKPYEMTASYYELLSKREYDLSCDYWRLLMLYFYNKSVYKLLIELSTSWNSHV